MIKDLLECQRCDICLVHTKELETELINKANSEVEDE